MRPGGAGREVHRHDPEPSDACFDVAALRVELAAREAAPYFVRRFAAVERSAAIALLVGVCMAALVELQAVELRVEVRLLAFHFLEAYDVGLLRREPAEQAPGCRRPDAVDVERYYSQPPGGVDTPPCAADHLAGSCRNFSTSSSWRASR